MNNPLITLSIIMLMLLSICTAEAVQYSEFQPRDNGGPETTQGSGTRWTT